MNIWWVALDLKYTSYEEVKHRKVIAQGWPQIGDLRTIYSLASDPANERLFKDVIVELGRLHYKGGDNFTAPEPMWNLSQVRLGDLLVGIEGTKVRGICQADRDAITSYRFDNSGYYNYAQTVCAPVEWREWDKVRMGEPPRAPGQSVLGIRRLRSEQEYVIKAWNTLT